MMRYFETFLFDVRISIKERVLRICPIRGVFLKTRGQNE